MHSTAPPRPREIALQVEHLDPATLSPDARRDLADELYAVQARVFDGVSRTQFASYVLNSSALRSRLLVARCDGRAVGYLAFHLFEVELDGRRQLVVRLESGYEHGFRGRSTSLTFFAREILRACLRHPFVSKHFLGCFVHPTAYIALARLTPLWPRPERATSAQVERVSFALADHFGLRRVDRDRGDIREIGWITRECEREASRWREHADPHARMFVERNPGYGEGHGLVVYAPVSVAAFVRGGGRFARRRLRQAITRWRQPRVGTPGSRTTTSAPRAGTTRVAGILSRPG